MTFLFFTFLNEQLFFNVVFLQHIYKYSIFQKILWCDGEMKKGMHKTTPKSKPMVYSPATKVVWNEKSWEFTLKKKKNVR